MSPRHCEERSDEASNPWPRVSKDGLLHGACHRARIRDPLARNDGLLTSPRLRGEVGLHRQMQSGLECTGLSMERYRGESPSPLPRLHKERGE
jgi:hypothetical protein